MPSALDRRLDALDKGRFDVSGNRVTCWFGPRERSRRHVVRVEASDDGLRLEATVATRRTVDGMDDADLWTWRRNRATTLVGFRVDARRRLVAETVLPHDLSSEEFAVCLHALAVEADRMELVLTGEDVQ